MSPYLRQGWVYGWDVEMEERLTGDWMVQGSRWGWAQGFWMGRDQGRSGDQGVWTRACTTMRGQDRTSGQYARQGVFKV